MDNSDSALVFGANGVVAMYGDDPLPLYRAVARRHRWTAPDLSLRIKREIRARRPAVAIIRRRSATHGPRRSARRLRHRAHSPPGRSTDEGPEPDLALGANLAGGGR